MSTKLSKDKALTVGIVGFGTFGQFMARRFVQAGHRVIATSRTPYFAEAAALGAEYYEDADDFCEEHPDVVVLATSILSTEPVVRALPLARLKRSTLFVDVLSVKVFPKQLLLRLLPPEVDILCTHPMFGPDSGKGSWEGLNFMYEAVRLGDDPRRAARLENFLAFFRGQGCRMVEMSCEEHDRQAASTQFVTHTVGRMLGAMELGSTDINTRGYEALLQLVENTRHDSFDLYYGLFLYNTNATDELERLEQAFDVVKKQLLGRLHDIARKQLFPADGDAAAAPAANGGSAPASRSSSAASLGRAAAVAGAPSAAVTLGGGAGAGGPKAPREQEAGGFTLVDKEAGAAARPQAADELERLEQAFDVVKKQLLGRLHDIARKQLFPADGDAAAAPAANGGSAPASRSSSAASLGRAAAVAGAPSAAVTLGGGAGAGGPKAPREQEAGGFTLVDKEAGAAARPQ
ncbi:TYRAAT2 [Scenedesmus sp. PABB004]|nr:TYRAAT2 [Scenedesmus sp. PABB004]